MTAARVKIGTSPAYSPRARYQVWVEVRWDGNRLSIMGEHYPVQRGSRGMGRSGSCGQNRDDVARVDRFEPGWDRERLARLLQVWDRWHLNDMRAGCEHQRAFGWDDMHRIESGARYGRAKISPAAVRAFERVGRPCPVCGYRYGTAWLHEPVPADVLTFVEELIAEGIPA